MRLYYNVLFIQSLGYAVSCKSSPTNAASSLPKSKSTSNDSTKCPKSPDWSNWRRHELLPNITRNNDYQLPKALKYSYFRTKNTVYSSLSVIGAILPLIHGASGPTQAEMIKSMGLTKFSENTHGATRTMLRFIRDIGHKTSLLVSGGQVEEPHRTYELPQYSMAVALLTSDSTSLKKSYRDDITGKAKVTIMNLDFKSKDALKQVNGYFSSKTNGKIDKMFTKLNPLTKLIVASTLYFKAAWTVPFNKRATYEHPFTLENNRKVKQVQMMKLRHYSDEGKPEFYHATLPGDVGDVLRLPLGPHMCKTAFTITFYRPAGASKVHDLTNYVFDTILKSGVDPLKGTRPVHVDVRIPKFKVETRLPLKRALKRAGMKLAFTDNADFRQMFSGEGLRIGDAKHQAVFEVDEIGVEGSAATAITMRSRSMRTSPKIKFTLDVPFLFSVNEVTSGASLFFGRVNDPTLNK